MDNDRVKFRVFYAVVVSIVFLLIFISVTKVFGFGSYPLPVQPMAESVYTNVFGATVKSSDNAGTNNNPVYREGFWCWINSNKCDYYALAYHDINNYLHYLIIVKPVYQDVPLYECAGYSQYRGTVTSNQSTWSMSNQNNYTSQNTSFSARSVVNDNDGSTWYIIGNSFLQYFYTDEAIFNKVDDSISVNTAGMSFDEFFNYIFDTYEPNVDYNETSYDETIPTFRTINVSNTQVTTNYGGAEEGLMFNAFNLGTYLRDVVVDLGDGTLSDDTEFDNRIYRLQFAFSVDSVIKPYEGTSIGLKKFVGTPFAYQSSILTYNNLFQRTTLSSLNLIGTIEGNNVDDTLLGQLKNWIHKELTGTSGVVYYKSISCYVRLIRISDNHYGNWTIGTYDDVFSGYRVINAKPIGNGLAYVQTLQQTSTGQGATQGVGIHSGYTYTASSTNGDYAYMSDDKFGGNSFADFSNLSNDIKQVPVIISTVFSFLPPQILALVGVCFALLVIFFILKFLQ